MTDVVEVVRSATNVPRNAWSETPEGCATRERVFDDRPGTVPRNRFAWPALVAAVVVLVLLAAVSAAFLARDSQPDPRHEARPAPRPASSLVPGTWEALPGPGDDLLVTEGSATWAGDELFVWGYTRAAQTDVDGARRSEARLFDPRSGTWRSAAPTPLRLIRFGATLVWTGSEVVVLGGSDPNFDGELPRDAAAYDPRTDTWRSLPELPLRWQLGAVWTGSRVLVVGGGAEYQAATTLDLDDRTWSPVARLPESVAPGASDVGVAWDGTRAIVRWHGTTTDAAAERTLRFDPRTARFEDLGTRTVPRGSSDLVGRPHSAAVVASNAAAFLRIEFLGPDGEEWVTGPAAPATEPCIPRLTAVGRRIVVWCPSGAPPWVFESGTWKVLPPPPEATFGPFVWSGRALYGIGASGDLLVYTPAR